MKIRFRGNWSPEAILFLLSMLFILAVIVPWLARHSPDEVSVPGQPARVRRSALNSGYD